MRVGVLRVLMGFGGAVVGSVELGGYSFAQMGFGGVDGHVDGVGGSGEPGKQSWAPRHRPPQNQGHPAREPAGRGVRVMGASHGCESWVRVMGVSHGFDRGCDCGYDRDATRRDDVT